MKTAIRHGITLATLGALLLGAATLLPAHADDYSNTQKDIHRDINAIRKDQDNLQGLYHKLHDQQRHGDWRNARGTQQRIIYTRINLRRDEDLLRSDEHALNHLRH